jgi:hypothetical protein
MRKDRLHDALADSSRRTISVLKSLIDPGLNEDESPNGPSITTESTSASKVQLLTFVEKFHANSTLIVQSMDCSNI